MQVEIWSDVLCPWCAIGRARFAEALSDYPHRDEVQVSRRSFQLDANAPVEVGTDMIGHIGGKYGLAPEQAREMLTRVVDAGAEAGLDIRFDRVRPSNSFLAHQLLHEARAVGGYELEDRLEGRLFAAYLTEGELIGDRATLESLAGDVGLDPAAAAAALADGRHASAVRAEQTTAAQLGINSVPAFVVDRTYLVPGAQPPETMRMLLDRARTETRLAAVPAGDACDDGSCAV